MLYRTDDLRIKWTKVVLPPVFLEEELPETENASSTMYHARKQICDILDRKDHRLLVICGPCSIHDTKAAREYAGLLKGAIAELSNDLLLVMRVYFEKPRTTVGWKGLLNDPYLEVNRSEINDGLRLARHLLLDLAEMGVPAGTELFGHDLAAVRRGFGELGRDRSAHHGKPNPPAAYSGLSCPVGFKNATSGDAQLQLTRLCRLRSRTRCYGHTKNGQSAIFVTTGNPDTHVILRGGKKVVNYGAEAVDSACKQLEEVGLPARVMIDCSHANSSKDYKRQALMSRRGGANLEWRRAHYRRDAGEQSGRRSAEVGAGQAAGLRAKHHRSLPGLERNYCAAEGTCRRRARRSHEPSHAIKELEGFGPESVSALPASMY